MSITDELRDWADDKSGEIAAIADRIDAEHESKVSYWQDASYKDGYDEGFASADDYFTDKSETLKEHGWVKLPVDADGVPLRVGDEIEYPNGARDTVRFATISPIGWAVNDRGWKPEAMRHYTPPTVEDVLREFAEKVIDSQIPDVHPTYEEAIAEYAAKLRLKEGE